MFANKGDVKGLKLEGLGTNHQLELAIALHFLAGSIRELEADLCLHFRQARHARIMHKRLARV